MYLISASILFIIILVFYYYHINKNVEILDIDKYKLNIKPPLDPIDKFNIKEYGIINENIIIHNKYKKELEGLKKNKYIIDKKKEIENQKILEIRNEQINKNSKKIKLQDLQKSIDLTKDNIKSLKISFKLELNKFLNDVKQNRITKSDLNSIISNLSKQLIENNKLIENTHNVMVDDSNININDIEYTTYVKLLEEYLSLLNNKNIIIQKKLNIYIKFLNNY